MADAKQEKKHKWDFHPSKISDNSTTLKSVDWECPVSSLYCKTGFLLDLTGLKASEDISLDQIFRVDIKAK